MEELDNVRHLLRLKEIERIVKVSNRMESPAEHTWGSIILAEYFLKRFDFNLNETKVMKLLLYHDLIEIETGDVSFIDEKNIREKPQKEKVALEILKKKIPKKLLEEYIELFKEFGENKTREAKFAQAIDKIEPMIHLIDYKEEWKKYGINERVLREKKQKFIEPFPELLKFFNQVILYLKENNYF